MDIYLHEAFEGSSLFIFGARVSQKRERETGQNSCVLELSSVSRTQSAFSTHPRRTGGWKTRTVCMHSLQHNHNLMISYSAKHKPTAIMMHSLQIPMQL